MCLILYLVGRANIKVNTISDEDLQDIVAGAHVCLLSSHAPTHVFGADGLCIHTHLFINVICYDIAGCRMALAYTFGLISYTCACSKAAQSASILADPSKRWFKCADTDRRIHVSVYVRVGQAIDALLQDSETCAAAPRAPPRQNYAHRQESPCAGFAVFELGRQTGALANETAIGQLFAHTCRHIHTYTHTRIQVTTGDDK
jgi:hypothetical protein